MVGAAWLRDGEHGVGVTTTLVDSIAVMEELLVGNGTAVVIVLTRGVPLEVASEILGHSSIAITGDIHGHVSPDVARHAVDLLGDALDR